MFSSNNKQKAHTHTHKSHAFLPHSIWSSKKGTSIFQFPGDSIRDLFIPDRWRSRFTIEKGHVFTHHPKRVTAWITRLVFFFQSDRRWAEISRWCWDRKVEFEWCLLGLAWGGIWPWIFGVLNGWFFWVPKNTHPQGSICSCSLEDAGFLVHFCLIISFLVNICFGWARFREVFFFAFFGCEGEAAFNILKTKKPTATKCSSSPPCSPRFFLKIPWWFFPKKKSRWNFAWQNLHLVIQCDLFIP